MQEIQGVHLEAARNAAHYELVHSIMEFAEKCNAVTQEMAAAFNPFKAAVEAEGRLLGISLRSEITQKLDLNDRERDGIVTGAKAIANALTKDADTKVAEAAALLNNEFISLKVDNQANYMQQTGQIDILLASLLGSFTEQLETCGLTQAIAFLKAANDRMHELLNQRDIEQAPRSGTAMQDARALTDHTYRAFIKLYNAWILVNATQLAANDRGTALFSAEANAKIEYFKRYVLKDPTAAKPEDVGGSEGTEGSEGSGESGGSGTPGGSENSGDSENSEGSNPGSNPGTTPGGSIPILPGEGGDDPDL